MADFDGYATEKVEHAQDEHLRRRRHSSDLRECPTKRSRREPSLDLEEVKAHGRGGETKELHCSKLVLGVSDHTNTNRASDGKETCATRRGGGREEQERPSVVIASAVIENETEGRVWAASGS